MARFQQTMQAVGLVAAPLTLITALLFYIGWQRTASLFSFFGVDQSLVGLSLQDYVLRSVDGLWTFLGAGLLASLLGWWGHRLLRRFALLRGRVVATGLVGALLLLLGAAVFVVGVVTTVDPGWLLLYDLVSPLLLIVGLITWTYGRWVLRWLPGQRRGRPKPPERSTVEHVIVGLLLMLALFWAAQDYAVGVGRGQAQTFAFVPSSRPGAVVYSDKQLFLAGPGVREDKISTDPAAAYHYRYTGLRLLSSAGTRMFLLPVRWTRKDSVIIVDYGAGIRLELVPET